MTILIQGATSMVTFWPKERTRYQTIPSGATIKIDPATIKYIHDPSKPHVLWFYLVNETRVTIELIDSNALANAKARLQTELKNQNETFD